jgi:peptidyl-Lys metalloendopeptidase
MFFSYLHASLVALVSYTVTVSVAPGLTVKTPTPNANVDGLENLKVTATITNTGDLTLKLLNDPRGVLDAFPENSFNITGATGSRPLFNGAKVSCGSGHPINMCIHAFGSHS